MSTNQKCFVERREKGKGYDAISRSNEKRQMDLKDAAASKKSVAGPQIPSQGTPAPGGGELQPSVDEMTKKGTSAGNKSPLSAKDVKGNCKRFNAIVAQLDRFKLLESSIVPPAVIAGVRKYLRDHGRRPTADAVAEALQASDL
jgi:hypothetical protein